MVLNEMTKLPKFFHTLNLPPRSPKHGQYRRPNPAAHRRASDGTSNSAGRPSEDGTVAAFKAIGNTPFYRTKPPAIPYAGIRTGEIIGHRLWWIIKKDGEDWLCSIAHRRLWTPGETVYGDVDKTVMMDMVLLGHIWGGTYAYSAGLAFALEVQEMKRLTDLVREFGGDFSMLNPFSFPQWCALRETSTFAVGRIKMWGEVIEHKDGYRAEYAKLLAIDAVYGDCDIDKLREKYLGCKQ